MKKLVLEGTQGLLSGEIDWPDDPPLQRTPEEDAAATKFIFDVLDRQIEERRKREAEAELQPEYDYIDAYLLPYLKDELAAEVATARPTPQAIKDFHAFRDFCKRNGFPALPARPQPVAEFLASLESNASRFRNSISTIHRAVAFDDPCDDILVRALMRLLRSEKSNNSPQSEKGNDDAN
jgi:hypothetical protein